MAQYQMIVLIILNSILVIFVAGQTELVERDVEIISGKNIDHLSDVNPLDAKYAGQFSQNIYAPPNVSSIWIISPDILRNIVHQMLCCLFIHSWVCVCALRTNIYINAGTRTKLAGMEYAVGR